MTNFPGGKNVLSYLGTRAVNPPHFIKATRAPTARDLDHDIGTLWSNETNGFPYMLTRIISGVPTWSLLGTSSSGVQTLTGDVGGPIPSDAFSNLNILGATAQGVSVNGVPATNTLTVTVGDSTEVAKGVVIRATAAEVIAGVQATDYVAPLTLAGKLGTQTAWSIPYGTGTSNAIGWTSTLADGALVIGSTGLAPTAATLTAGAGVSILNAPGSITISSTSLSTWTRTAAPAVAALVDNAYVATAGVLQTFTLPAVAVVGDTVRVVGEGAGGWSIAQNAGQTVRLGNVATTTGAGGSTSSSNQYDSLTLVCTIANTDWRIDPAPIGVLNLV